MKTVQDKCLRLLEVACGSAGLQVFLRTPQPEFGDLTGDELLEAKPELVLARLLERERAAKVI